MVRLGSLKTLKILAKVNNNACSEYFQIGVKDTSNILSNLGFNVKEQEKRKIVFLNKQIENK